MTMTEVIEAVVALSTFGRVHLLAIDDGGEYCQRRLFTQPSAVPLPGLSVSSAI